MKEEHGPIIKGQFLQEVAQLFVGQSHHVSENLDFIEQLVINAAQKYDDALTIQWLEILEEVVCKTLPPVNDVSSNDYCKRLRDLYWHLSQIKNEKIAPRDSLLKTKRWILSRAIKGWYAERTSMSIETFQFFLAVFMPIEERLELCHAPEVVISKIVQEGWVWRQGAHSAVQTIVIDLIREHTGPTFTPQIIEEWLVEPDIPREIAEVILHTWVRNGGWLLMQQHLRNKKILEPFEPEKRSEAACKFLEHVGYVVVALENDVARLFATIPEELQKGAKYKYDRLDQLSLWFYLAERQSPEKEARLYNQTHTAIERWIEWKKTSGLKISVHLDFRLGDEFTSAFRKEERML